MTEPRQRPEGERAASERSASERAESELVEFVRSIDVRAPDSLHTQVQALVADASRRKGRPRIGHRRSPALANYAFAGTLAAAVQGVAFPYWEERFGWRATGARSDHVNGRAVTTVFYADRHGRQIGYAIVHGTPAPKQDRGGIALRGGTRYRVLQLHGATVVSWLRDGHLCVLAARGVDGATLLALASWQERGTAA